MKHVWHSIVHGVLHLILHPESRVTVLYIFGGGFAFILLIFLIGSASPNLNYSKIQPPAPSTEITNPAEKQKLKKAYSVLVMILIPLAAFLLYLLYKRLAA